MRGIILAGLVLIAAAPATAQVVTYTSQVAFDAATINMVDYGIQTPDGGYGPTAGSYADGPFTITSSDLQYVLNDGGYGDNNYLDNLQTIGGGPYVSVAISGDHHAVGFDIGAFYATGTVNVTINGIGGYSFTATSAPDWGFFGITSDSAITSVSFTTLSFGEIDMLGFHAGDVAQSGTVPEPASWALMLAGFGAVGGFLRRRRTPVLA